jgi:hypothetical protein
LWRDGIQAFLSPTRVDLARHRSGIKRRESSRHSAACQRKQGLAAWEPPLKLLGEILADAAGADLRVTLSNHFVRYAVISHKTRIETPVELSLYAEFLMRQIFGDRTGNWELGVSEWDPGSGAICAAIERELLEGLQGLAADHKVRLKGVEPYLTSTIDWWRTSFDRKKTWFALLEAERICIALLSDGAWQRISNRRMLLAAEVELLSVLDQEAILFSEGKKTLEEVYLYAPEHPQLTLPNDCGWRIVSPLTGSRSVPPHYPVALDALG